MRPHTLLFTLAAAASVSGGCQSNPATQFTVGVMSQIVVPKELRSVRVTASVSGDIKFCQTYPVDDGTTSLPQSLALAPGGDPSRPVTVTVVGFEKSKDDVLAAIADECQTGPVAPDPASAHILRRSRQPYVPSRNLYVPMPLRYACMGVDCKAGETCKGGRCVAPDVDVHLLPDFASELLFGNTKACFDEDACLGDAIGPTVVDASQCVYEVPPGSSVRDVGMNVRAIYEGHGVEVLDLDADEGFFLPDASRPNRFQLAPGLCHPQMGARQIVNVNASRACASKNVFQPMCVLTPRALSPSRSALYVLLDRESAMSEYVGASAQPGQALDAVLRVALGDPVFSATTSVALKLVGDLGAPCASGSYRTPDAVPGTTGFTDVWKAANPIADFVKGAATTAGVKLAADAALPDAAAGLPAVTGPRAVLLVTNRDPLDAASSCGGSVATAIGGLLAGTRAWVMSLRRTGESDPMVAARAADVKSLSPGATVISAEGPDTAASQAAVVSGLGALVGALAACQYDDPGALDAATSELVFDAPGPAAPVKVPADAGCTAGASVDGWSVSGGVVRICGASCTALRSAIQAAAQASAAKSAMSPSQGQQVLVFVRPKP